MSARQIAPRGLGPAGKSLWKAMTAAFSFEPAEVLLLEQAARTADVVAELETALDGAPVLVLGSRKQVIVNPGFQELRLQRLALQRLLNGFGQPEDEDALTPSQRGRRAAQARWQRTPVAS